MAAAPGTMPDPDVSAMDDAPTPDPVPCPRAPIDAPPRPSAGEPDPFPPRLGVTPPRDPGTTDAWLHVVSAPSVPLLSRAVFELAARFLAGGHRVMLVDAAPRLRLHDRFDRESRWGVVECLRGDLPVLGLLQETGRLGLYLLAHGTREGGTRWERLAAMLEEARPHVGRAVVALDPDAPPAVGEALAGVHLEGWWPRGGSEARRAAGIGGRLGIPFSDLDLDELLVPRLEALDARVWSLAAPSAGGAGAPTAEPAAAEDRRAPAAGAETESAPPALAGAEAEVPLAGDRRVRERLRFLLWMRRVESEAGGAAAATVPSAGRETA